MVAGVPARHRREPDMPLAGASRRLRSGRLVRAGVTVVVLMLVGACSGDDATTEPQGSGASSSTTTVPATTVGATTPTATASAPTTTAPPPPTPLENINIRLRRVATMNSPIAMATRAGRREIWVAERAGRVRVYNPANNAVSEPIVDISSTVSNGGERGLLGLAFSPDGNRLYLSYTNTQGNSRIDEFTM